jgi:methyl-accepting chemotaxis protein
MNKLTVRSRLLMGFILVISFLIMMLAFAIYQQNKLADLNLKQYNHPFMVTNGVARADGNIVRMSRLMKDIAMVKDDAEIVKLSQQVDSLEQQVIDDLVFAKSRYLTSPEEMEKLIQLFKSWKPIRDQVIALKREGKGQEAGELTRTAGGPKLAEIFAASGKIYDIAMKKAESFQEASAQAHRFSTQMTWLAGIVSILLALVISFVLTRSITRQLGGEPLQLIDIANQLADGKWSDAPVISEKGSAMHAVLRLKSVLSEVLIETNQVVKAMANGQFNQRIVGHYAGELENLKKGVNSTATTVSTMMNQLSQLMTALHAGSFNAKIDMQAEGVFGEVSDLAMDTMTKLNLAIKDINAVMAALSRGDFSARVTAEVAGDLLEMKQSINHSLQTLDTLTDELVHLANAQLQGDLTQIASGSYQGRFKVLQDARTASTDKIKEVIIVASDAAVSVTDAAALVEKGASDLSARVQQQAAALEQTSATMNEMATTVQTNTANARQVADLAHEVQNQSIEGVSVMSQTINAMKSIQQSSSQIGDIVSIIDSIAFQTNLLALNAAVEAARAGEHGRGFAVVASEVRALAGKSADAAKDIKNLIEESAKRVDNGTQLAERSGSMLQGINKAVETVAMMADEIAKANAEQSQGIAQVHNAIAQIDVVTQHNAALVEQTTQAAESLGSEANNLQKNMSFFKTGRLDNKPVRLNRTEAKSATKATALPSHSYQQPSDWNEF